MVPGYSRSSVTIQAGGQPARPDTQCYSNVNRARFEHRRGKSNRYVGKSKGYMGGREQNPWQPGMCRGISDVRGYVALQAANGEKLVEGSSEKAGNSEKHPRYPGMYKGMRRLRGYVAGGGRDSWNL